MIKALIFDLWETLGTKNIGVSKTLSKHFGINITPDYLMKYEAAVQLEPWHTKSAMAENFLTAFSLPLTQENTKFVIDLFDEAIAKATPYPGTIELLNKLHTKYKLGLLSNTTIFEAKVPENWGIRHIFDAEIYSWQLQSLKPARKNFEAICAQLNVLPNESVLIDDNKVNTEAATQFGMKTIQFISNAQLTNELARLL